MPCYDSRNDPDYVREEAKEHFRHNSEVAEFLCKVLTGMGSDADNVRTIYPEIGEWWDEHRARDAAKTPADENPAPKPTDPITLEQALKIVQRRRKNYATSGEAPNRDTQIMFALVEELDKRSGGVRDDDGDLLVTLGDLSGFNMKELKRLMGQTVDNNHEAMVEEHIKAFNYAVTQGIHPGQALFACAQAVGSLFGFAVRSGLDASVAGVMVALIMKQTQQSAKEVRIVTPS